MTLTVYPGESNEGVKGATPLAGHSSRKLTPPTKLPPIRPSVGNMTASESAHQSSSFVEICCEKVGGLVGRWPAVFLIISLCLCSLSYGMRHIWMEDRLKDGYTPVDAPSKMETEVYNEFFGQADSEPMTMVMIHEARDGESMIREEYLDETVNAAEFFLKNFTVKKKDTEETFTFNDLCEPNCGINGIFKLFRDTIRMQVISIEMTQELIPGVRMDYPLGEMQNIDINFASRFFGVIRWENDGILRSTNMKSVKAFMLLFRSDTGSEEKKALVERWHRDLFTYIMNTYSSDTLDIKILSTTLISDEMNKSSQKAMPFFGLGFLLMTSFVVMSIIGTSFYAGEKINFGKFLVGAGAVVAPIMAITTTFGLMTLLGYRTNSIMLITPFLVMAIGVDDAFLMMNSWHHVLHKRNPLPSPEDQMAFVFKDAGPSILITSLTNGLAFGVGAISPTPEIRLFCTAAMLAMCLDFVYEVTLFGSFLSFASRMPSVKMENRGRLALKVDEFIKEALHGYCQALSKLPVFMAVMVLTGALLAVSVYGVLTFESRLDAGKVLPQDSPMQDSNKALESMVWNDYHPVTVLVNKQTDLSDPYQYEQLKKMVKEFEELDHSLGPEATQLWVKDYITFTNLRKQQELAIFGDIFDEVTTVSSDTVTFVDLQFIEAFFTHRAFKAWEGMVKWNVTDENKPIITKFVFLCAYEGTAAWSTRIELMQKWRAIVAKYEMFNATVWESNGHFVDQMLSLKTVTLETVLVTLLVMTLVCFVFIRSIVSILCASLAIGSICLGVVGFMRHWGIDLDPIVMAALLMSIGLSVDFTAHITYHFVATAALPGVGSAADRLELSLQAIVWPMIQASCSTVLCVAPLALLKGQYAPEIFFKTIMLVVLFGTLHGLVILPAVLVALPTRFTGNRMCFCCVRPDAVVHAVPGQPPTVAATGAVKT